MQSRRGCRLWPLLAALLFSDRLSKLAAQAALSPGGARTAVPGVLSWAYARNRGAAFSLLSDSGGLLIFVALALLAGVLIYLLRHPDAPALERAGLWMIAGGGLGNLWDRLAYGYVIDFIRLDFVDFPVFNLADVYVCAGAALALLSLVRAERRRKRDG